jgi:hypothetical protein
LLSDDPFLDLDRILPPGSIENRCNRKQSARLRGILRTLGEPAGHE